MIRYLRGRVRDKSLAGVIIDTGGVGYFVTMPLTDIAQLPDDGGEAEVHVHTNLPREGSIELFGFLSTKTLDMFERLISISGVGPRSAIGILSGIDVDDLVAAVMAGDEKRLQKAPGVGKKTAARIVLELRDKLEKEGLAKKGQAVLPVARGPLSDLESALANLGYRAPQIERAIAAVRPLVEQGAPLEQLVRESLSHV